MTEDFKDPKLTKRQVAGYSADMLASISEMSKATDLTRLAQLADIAQVEAIKHR